VILQGPLVEFHDCRIGYFMFFFRRKFAKKFEDRNKNPSKWKVLSYVSNTKCFFSGMEIAFVSSNKIYLEIEKNKIISFQKFWQSLQKPTNFIVTMLIGNTMATWSIFYRQTVLLWLGICHFIFSMGLFCCCKSWFRHS
jgi:hypothetical protein